MGTTRVIPLVVAALLLFTGVVAAQEGAAAEASQDTVYHLVLVDGSSFYGHIESRDAERVAFVTLGGTRLEVQTSRIRTLEPASGRVVEGEVWHPDPNRTRLFFGPTGRSLGTGEGYIGLFELFFSFGAVGVGDRLVLAGGTPVVPGGFGDVFYLAPKLRVASLPRADFAVGVLAFFFTEAVDAGSVGLLYGVGTVGDQDNAVTAGAGWAYVMGGGDSEVADEPVLLLGWEGRTSRSIKVISENYLVVADGAFGLLSGGVRFLGERFSADIGVGAAFGEGNLECCLPVLSASYSF